MSLRQRQWLGAIIFVLMFGHFGVNAYFILVKLEQLGRSSDGWAARVRADGKAEITEVTRGGPATVLREGDELVSINGVSPKDNPELLTISRHVSPGTPYTIAVRRQGQLLEFTLATIARPLGQWLRPLADVFVPLLFLLTGLAVFLLKPADWQAWLLALMLSSFTGLFNEVLPPMPMMLSWWMVLARIMGILFLPIFFHFFLIFPERSPLLARFPRLERWLYLPFFFVLPWFAFSRMLAIFRTQAGLRAFFENAWVLKSRWMGLLSLSVAIGYLIAGLGALLVGYRSAGVAARRKLTVIVAGSIAGMANLLAIVIWETLFHSRFPNAREWLAMPLPLTLSLVPLSFAYAIARHQVIPVSLILRRGVRYVLVSRGSLALHLLLAMLAMFVFMEILFGATPNLSGRAIGAISCAVGILLWNLNYAFHRRVLAPAIDRHFFRQSYDAQQIMTGLTQSLRSVTNLPELLELVAAKIQSALQTESVTIFLRDRLTGDFHSVHSLHHQAEGEVKHRQLSATAPILHRLTADGEPMEIDNNEAPPDDDRQTLREMNAALLLPLTAKEELMGLIVLGPRLGDLPFSRADKHLLISVAGPTAFAIENSRLMERAIADARRRQELEAENEQRAKELEEARQLQLSMLPKQLPQLPHLEIAAYMKTATEVGGDYYDFHLSESGELTVVVGDATGHGLKAGTVVTATKSLFNHLAQTPEITEIFQHSSRALKRMNLRSMFMAMTMVKLKDYRLTICSAGMPPALIYRAREHRVEEVFIKGIPLGSFPGYVYCKEELMLSPGDVVLLLSDGLPERFNSEGEMLGYDKPSRSLLEVAHRPSQEIIEHFIHLGETWAGGKSQDDDVTLVVLRLS